MRVLKAIYNIISCTIKDRRTNQLSSYKITVDGPALHNFNVLDNPRKERFKQLGKRDIEMVLQKTKTRIIIADDHDCFTEILKLTLEDAGMQVVKTASTGRQAVEATLEYQPDCLLLDISMPDMDGLAALANIKFLDPTRCVIIISALKDPFCKIRAMELGADAFFSKEGSMDELLALICALVAEECPPVPTKPNNHPIFPSVPRIKLINREPESSAT